MSDASMRVMGRLLAYMRVMGRLLACFGLIFAMAMRSCSVAVVLVP